MLMMWCTSISLKRWRKSWHSAKSNGASGNSAKMRGAHAVFRAVLCMHLDSNVSHYELTFRVCGVDRAIAIKRLGTKTHNQIQAELPFDPVVVELQSCPDSVLMDSVPGSYVVKMAFLKRDRSGTIVASVPVNWALSPMVGVHGELAAGAQSFFSPFVVTIHRALLTQRSWKASVERPCVKSRLQCGVFAFEGFVKSALVEAGPRWWARLRIQVELLQNGTLNGICIGESHRTSVSGVWTADAFDMSMDFRRPGSLVTTPIRLESHCISGNRFTKKIQADSEDHERPFVFEIVQCGYCSAVRQVTPPLAFYQEARLAVLSSYTKRESAPSQLTGPLWRRIFAFYDSPWFVPVRPLKKPELYSRQTSFQVPQHKSEEDRRNAAYPTFQTFGTVSNSDGFTRILVKTHEERILRNTLSPQPNTPSTTVVVEQHWATILYLVVAFIAITWSFHAPSSRFFKKLEEDAVCIDCARSFSSNSFYYDRIAPNVSAVDNLPTQWMKEPDTRVDQRSIMRLKVLIIANTGLALLRGIHPYVLFSALLTTGFLFSRRRSVGIGGSFVESCSEVAILLATMVWFCSAASARSFTSWNALPNISRSVFWSCSYVLLCFVAVSAYYVVAVLGSMIPVILAWTGVKIY